MRFIIVDIESIDRQPVEKLSKDLNLELTFWTVAKCKN